MKILEPQVELIHQGDDEALHIAKCARICYASNKLVDNEKMCNHLWKNHHHSMFRHVGVYYKIPYNEISSTIWYIERVNREEIFYGRLDLRSTQPPCTHHTESSEAAQLFQRGDDPSLDRSVGRCP